MIWAGFIVLVLAVSALAFLSIRAFLIVLAVVVLTWLAALMAITMASAAEFVVKVQPKPGALAYRVHIRQVPTPWALAGDRPLTPTPGSDGSMSARFSWPVASGALLEARVSAIMADGTESALSAPRRWVASTYTRTPLPTRTRTPPVGSTPTPTLRSAPGLMLFQQVQ